VTIDNGGSAPTSDSAPVLAVTSPANGAVVQGHLAVTGIAASGRFQSVRAFVGKGLAPTSVTQVDSQGVPVLSGTIADWDTTTVEDGPYVLRITLNDATYGDASTDLTVVVRNKGVATPAAPH
jgi:hypothetical protein